MAPIAGLLPASKRDWTNVGAVLCVLAATAIFSLIFISGRMTGEMASPFQIMFLRYAGGFITVAILAALRGETWSSLQSRHRPSQALRVLAGGLGGAAVIFGNAHMPLVDANAISLLSGVFTLGLGFLIFHDRLPKWGIAGAAACIVGAIVVMAARGAFTTLDAGYLLPAAIVATGALLLAIEHIFIKLLAMSDRPLVTLAHANFFGMFVLVIPAALTWGSTGWVNLALLCLGPFAILGQYLNIRAYTATSISLLAPIGYSALVFAALWGWWFFGELPTAGVVAGCIIIAMGGTTLALSRR